MKWIKQKYGEELRIIRIGQKGYLETIEKALIQGTALIDNGLFVNVLMKLNNYEISQAKPY